MTSEKGQITQRDYASCVKKNTTPCGPRRERAGVTLIKNIKLNRKKNKKQDEKINKK